ncbi:MAG: sugar phosphate isomerase/epimerase [Lachnospiraceae bacterium]|nr:sugar phosphate isomerase/epimerase [Lachnospiraceae bacterium]MCQ2530515.1 sugar phosphate isomerase/epimerase [Lachnospiraceae bacterium]
MISTGIFTGYYPYTIDETIAKIKASDFSCVQLDVSFKDLDATKEPLTKEKANMIRDKFRDANLPIIAISAYTNFVHPDPVKRQENIDYLKMMIRYARDLGCPYVASETGTYNEESDWVWDDRNGSEKVFDEAIEIIKDITAYARDYGATFIVENYVNNVIGSVDQVLRMFDEVGTEGIGLICDPTNYFDEAHFGNIDGTLNEIFDKLAPYMKIAHAKDIMKAVDTSEKHADIDADASHSFRGSGAIELPAAGLGVLNYDLYVKRLAETHPNIPLIIEHLDEGDIERAKAFVDGTLKKVGV